MTDRDLQRLRDALVLTDAAIDSLRANPDVEHAPNGLVLVWAVAASAYLNGCIERLEDQ